MKILIALLLSASFAAAQTSPEKLAAEKELLAPYVAPGHGMAKDAYLATGGPIRRSVAGHSVYSKGAIIGLTKAQAIAKFEAIWAQSPAAVRMNWARKAMLAGTTVESQQAEEDRAAYVEAQEKARSAAAMEAAMKRAEASEIDRRLDELERQEHNRKVKGND